MLLAALLILSVFAAGCKEPCVMIQAPIHDTDIWVAESFPLQYFLHVVSGEPSGCYTFDSYNVTRTGNTTLVEIFNLYCDMPCAQVYNYVEHTIPLGSDFVSGGNYTVVVNNVTESFVAQ